MCWGVEKVKGDVEKSVGGVGKCVEVWGRCRKVCGRDDGVWELKCVGAWESVG